MLNWKNKEEIRNAIMNLGSENAHKTEGLLVRIKYLEDSDDTLPSELTKAQSSFLKILEDMVKEDRVKYEMDLIKSTSLSRSTLITSNPELRIEKYYRPFLVDQGQGYRLVQYRAVRIERLDVVGYGTTEEETLHNLIYEVQPL